MTEIALKGKIALVTGSARRLGKAMAMGLARQGMHQIIHHGNSPEEAEATAAEIRAMGVEALIVKADVSKPNEIDQLFGTISEHFGRLDVLVNSSSTFERGSLRDLKFIDWQHTLDVNLTAPFLCSQHAACLMRDGGSIVNMIDLSAFHPFKNQGLHSVSKAGLWMLTQTLALDLGPSIRVNAIAPGAVLRPDNADPEAWAKLGDGLPIKRVGSPDDVIQALLFLLTQPFMTGSFMRVDGGELLT
jgi:NAD(P)-dependent dehydrogenase (short-subunit alcohol dehydrogenase family)